MIWLNPWYFMHSPRAGHVRDIWLKIWAAVLWRWRYRSLCHQYSRLYHFDLRLNKRLSKHPKRRWFETPLRSLWRLCNDIDLSRGGDGCHKFLHPGYLCFCKLSVRCIVTHSYLTGIAADKLRWHLSNMSMPFIKCFNTCGQGKILAKEMGQLV